MAMFLPFVMAIHMIDEEGAGTTEKEDALLEKVTSKIDEGLAAKYTELSKEFQKLTTDAKKGLISEDQFNKQMEEINGKLEKYDAEAFKKYQEKIESLEETVKNQGTELSKLKDGGLAGGNKTTFKDTLKPILESDSYKEFVESGGKKKSSHTIKAVSVSSDYTGTSLVHITSRDPRVVDHPEIVRLNIRDLIVVESTDLPYLAFTEVYDWVNTVTTVGENTTLPESSFKVREATTDAKRIGTHIPLSKRMIKSVTFVMSHLARRLPAMVKYNEDFQLLWGDGAGNNPTGIFKVASDFTDLINTPIEGIAGSVSSVASYDSDAKAIVTFAANQLIKNGDIITFANATEATYNAAFSAVVISPTQILIDVAYVAEADTSAWTFTVNHPFKDSIDAAQQIDVLKVGRTLCTQQEYTCNGYVLNPVDATKIETLKGNDEHYLEVMRDGSGILRISGIPVVETTAMPAGYFALGDWNLACALYQFTDLTLEFSESTQEKLDNTVEAIIQEEILFPIYNKYMFVVGNFADAIEAIKV